MLTSLEAASGVSEVNVVIEACHSGSFVDYVLGPVLHDSLSKAGRVIITSTDRDHNAYASASGAYFSDAFFTCIASSKDLKTCFNQARDAVTISPNGQSPWMDDNGDHLYNNGSDGSVAQTRYVAKYFGASPPQIASAGVTVVGANGTLTAQVQEGGAKIDTVWAAVYAPSFQEPSGTTLNLGVPVVQTGLQIRPRAGGTRRPIRTASRSKASTRWCSTLATDRTGTRPARCWPHRCPRQPRRCTYR